MHQESKNDKPPCIGRTFLAEIRFGKCVPHIEQTSLRHRGISTSRLPGSGFPEPLLMLAED